MDRACRKEMVESYLQGRSVAIGRILFLCVSLGDAFEARRPTSRIAGQSSRKAMEKEKFRSPFTAARLDSMWCEASRDAGLDESNLHCLRHGGVADSLQGARNRRGTTTWTVARATQRCSIQEAWMLPARTRETLPQTAERIEEHRGLLARKAGCDAEANNEKPKLEIQLERINPTADTQ